MAQQDVVAAYVRLYTIAQLEAALQKALAAHSAGVTITSITFEGGGHQGQANGRPEDIIATLLAAIEAKEAIASGDGAPSHVSHWDFSNQPLGT